MITSHKSAGKLEDIEEQRGSENGYGDPLPNMRNIGKSWTAKLNQHYGIPLLHDIPADIVALMMADLKLMRASNSKYHEDNFDDAHIYLDFAQRDQIDTKHS